MTDHSKPARSFVALRHVAAAPAAGPGALKRAVVALGNFDGVHRGHRAVIATAMSRAGALGVPAAVMTFEPHPRLFFQPHEPLFRLTEETNKLRLLAATGLDGAVVMRFDAALASLPADEFVDRILVGWLGVSGAVVGFNFHFGKGRGGSPAFLTEAGKRRGFTVDVVPVFTDGGRPVSSGPIREALAQGDVAQANELLGYPWFVTGEVVHGDKRGRELGYPTANIRLDPSCALRYGIYAVRVGIGGRQYDGVANFGRRPMFDTGAVLLEVFLFDFSGDLYGRTLDVAFIDYIRHELAFDTIDDLIRRMDEDSRIARSTLARAPQAWLPPTID